jgi:hypothetical protein
MERVVHIAQGHDDARRWDIEQQNAMTPEERLRAAQEIKKRAFPSDAKDVRACHRSG